MPKALMVPLTASVVSDLGITGNSSKLTSALEDAIAQERTRRLYSIQCAINDVTFSKRPKITRDAKGVPIRRHKHSEIYDSQNARHISKGHCLDEMKRLKLRMGPDQVSPH